MCFNYGASPVPPSFGKTLIEHLIRPRTGGTAPSPAASPVASRSSLTEQGRMRPAGWEHARAGSCHSAFICGAIASSSAQTSSSHPGSEDVSQMERRSLPPLPQPRWDGDVGRTARSSRLSLALRPAGSVALLPAPRVPPCATTRGGCFTHTRAEATAPPPAAGRIRQSSKQKRHE